MIDSEPFCEEGFFVGQMMPKKGQKGDKVASFVRRMVVIRRQMG